jgi:dihydrolipoamide dehydrogenase
MQTMTVDVAVIGAGTAGQNARREVEKRGGRALLIERGPHGTTCARVGCMPSKLLVAAADIAHALAIAPQFGVHAGTPRVDGAAVMARVRRERDRFVRLIEEDIARIPAAQRLSGHARFTGPTTLLVDDATRVEARAVVVATGSHPFVPPPFDRILDRVLTSDDVFELTQVPASLAVIGTGVIALELGQALHRLGTRVTFLNPFDDLGPFTDPEVERVARTELTAELDLRLGVEFVDVETVETGTRLRWRAVNGATDEAVFEHVLVAAGRRPNVAGLGLEATGLPLDAKGRPQVDPATTQWGTAPIFFAGDAGGHRALLHEAADEGRIAGANAMLWPAVERRERRLPLAIAFTDPQMALVGARRADLAEGGCAVGAASFEDQGRARVAGRNRGLVRIYGEPGSGRLLGAEMFGPGMEHLAHLLAWAVQSRMTVETALSMPFYHPVLEEGLRTALRDLAYKLRAAQRCRPEDFATAPGT